MLIRLRRTRENHRSTVGDLTIDGPPVFVTLEDGFRRPKVHGETRIPSGEYDLKLRTEGGVHTAYLARFGLPFHKGILWLQDVPDFTFVYFHIGNVPEDTDGCILVGSHIIDGDPFKISESEKAYRLFYPRVRDAILRGDAVRVHITDPVAAEPLVA